MSFDHLISLAAALDQKGHHDMANQVNGLIEKMAARSKDIPVVATIVIFRKNEGAWEVLIERRGKKPSKSKMALPGGHLEEFEDGRLEDYNVAASRELKEETEIDIPADELIYVTERLRSRGKIKRDILYTAIIEMEDSKAVAGSDADEVLWIPVEEMPTLAFDHNLFVEEALKRISEPAQDEYVDISDIHLPVRSNRGFLIVFEGIDGAGKSTQIEKLYQKLVAQGYDVFKTKWSSSEILERVIKRCKDDRNMSEQLYSMLHASDMHYRYIEEILPALSENKIVICDRYIYTSFARDIPRGISPEYIKMAYQNFIKPDVIFHLKAPLEVTLKRLKMEKGLGYYGSGMDLHLHTDPDENYKAYQALVDKVYHDILPQIDTYKAISSDRAAGDVAHDIWDKISVVLDKHYKL